MIIGLTGGIASGKSTVSKMLKDLGAHIIDADIIARKVVEKGQKAYNRIVQSFGVEILQQNGELNRKKLGNIVFSDKTKLDLLNRITHPEIISSIAEEIAIAKAKGYKIIVLDAAMLLELGLQDTVDLVWLVVVSQEIQIKRLMERDKLSLEEAECRINSQFKNEEKIKYADEIINNEKNIEEVKEEVVILFSNLVLGENRGWQKEENTAKF